MSPREELLRAVQLLVDHPDEVELREERRGSTVRFELRVAEADRGQVIGRGGVTIRSLRLLLDARGDRHRQDAETYELEVLDD